jgi:hypothetical protein
MKRKRWRRSTISIAASLLAHLVLISPLLRVAQSLRNAPLTSRPDVQIDLVRAFDVTEGAPNSTEAAAKPVFNDAADRPTIRATADDAHAQPPPRRSSQQTPTSPTLTANAPVDVTTGHDAAGDARARAALRSALGCLNPNLANLTDAERAACRDRVRQAATAMGDATVDPISDIRKRAYYDDVKAARDAMNSYNPVNGPMPGNGPGFACKFGGKSGASCGVALPSGALTEEWGIKPP